MLFSFATNKKMQHREASSEKIRKKVAERERKKESVCATQGHLTLWVKKHEITEFRSVFFKFRLYVYTQVEELRLLGSHRCRSTRGSGTQKSISKKWGRRMLLQQRRIQVTFLKHGIRSRA